MTDWIHLGVDTGGTFTDFVCIESGRVRTDKVLSTPDDPSRAVLQGIARLGLEPALQAGRLRIVHGSTVATNAALEGKGVRTAYVTNRGFEDLLFIGRQTRATLYTLQPDRPPIDLDPALCFGTGGRIAADGSAVEALTDADLAALVAAIRAAAPAAIAINLLHAFVDDRHERRIEAALQPLAFVTRSSAVLAEYREYERGIATWLNAWLGPRVQHYLERLAAAAHPSPVAIMQSTGGTIAIHQAARHAVRLLLSGPAGGLAGAHRVATHAGVSAAMTFDMGGTSTDVAVIDGPLRLTTEGRLGPYPVAVPMADIHTIGAGGGSIARVDAGGLLRVGPESAGADPGPACYGRGGQHATVTDAHVVVGRLPEGHALAGSLRPDVAAAHAAIDRLAATAGLGRLETALGIIRVANERMEQALRLISVARGHDPRELALVAFGGAGGLHVCELADGLGASTILIPALAGVLSAWGMLVARPERQGSRTLRRPLAQLDAAELAACLAGLAHANAVELAAEGHATSAITHAPSVELRYRGQSAALALPCPEATALALDALGPAFEALHQQRYGHRLNLPVELLNARVTSHAPALALPAPHWQPDGNRTVTTTVLGDGRRVPVRGRPGLGVGERIDGPMLLTDPAATVWVDSGWAGMLDPAGTLRLERAG